MPEEIPIQIVEHISSETADKFLAAISLRGKHLWDSSYPMRWLFRGHGNDSWRLIPTALRPGAFKRMFEAGDVRHDPGVLRLQIQAECEVLSRFLQVVDSIGLLIPDDSMEARSDINTYFQGGFLTRDNPERIWMPNNFFAIAALAQHSGIPTRLLDWSASPIKAAYFAALDAARLLRERPDDTHVSLSVWAIERRRFSYNQYKIGSIIDGYGIPVVLFSVPRASNPNAHAQDGWFSVVREHGDLAGGVPREPLDEILKRHVLKPSAPVLKHFTLPIKEAPRLLWLLAVEQVNAAAVFRDFRGAADTVREVSLYPPPQERERDPIE